MSADTPEIRFSEATEALPPEERAQVKDFTTRLVQDMQKARKPIHGKLRIELRKHPERLDADARYVHTVGQSSISQGTVEEVPLLMLAVMERNPELLKPLVAAGCHIETKSNLERNPLGMALYGNDEKTVRAVIALSPDPNEPCHTSLLNLQEMHNPCDTVFINDQMLYAELLAKIGGQFNVSCKSSPIIPRPHDRFEELVHRSNLAKLSKWFDIMLMQGGDLNKPSPRGDYPIESVYIGTLQTTRGEDRALLMRMAKAGANLTSLEVVYGRAEQDNGLADDIVALRQRFRQAQHEWEAWSAEPGVIDAEQLLLFANLGMHRAVFGTRGVWHNSQAAQEGLEAIKSLPPYLQKDLQAAVTKLEDIVESASQNKSGSGWTR